MSYSISSVVSYVRNLIGLGDITSFKRNRTDDDLSDEDEAPPSYKRHKLCRTHFPDNRNSRDVEDRTQLRPKQYVRNVSIQVEHGHPSTSTPIDTVSKSSRVRTVPLTVKHIKENSSLTHGLKPRMHTPIPAVSHVVIDDDDDDDDDDEPQIIVHTKRGSKKLPKVIYLEDDDEDEETKYNKNDDEVQFVKKTMSPLPPIKSYKYFDVREPSYSKLSRNLNDRNSPSPKSLSKFVAPPGITKSYKRAPSVPKWLQGPGATKSTNFPRNRFMGLNGNTRSTMAEVFNLDEKKNYQELIRKVANSMKPASFGRPLDIINLADEAASFRNTMKSQRSALNEINLVERGLLAEKKNDSTNEYDPLFIASINSSDSEVEVILSDTSTSSSIRIRPINTLRDSHRDVAVTSTDWLSKIDSKYKKKKQLTQEKLVDAKRESDIISKVNSEQKIAQLEHKLKYHLCIPESVIEEPQPTVELPTLTPEQEKLVNRALGPGPPGSLIIEKFNLRIHKRDLQTLSGLNWLNDEVINFYMNLLMARSEQRRELPRVYAANTFFYPKLMQGGQAGLRRWTRKVDIFAHDLMVLPVHLGVHWCLAIVHFRDKKISYLDSMGGPNRACLAALTQYLKDEHQDKKGEPFDDSGWKADCLKDIPQQMNGSDCGMFACTFAEFSARDAPYSFTQAHMPYLRRKMALEIITGKLLL